MSVAQIFEELPKFNRGELREIGIRAMELSWDEAEREAMEFGEEVREAIIPNVGCHGGC